MTGFQIGFDALISLLSAVAGALAVWYTLKGKVEIQQVVLENLIVHQKYFLVFEGNFPML